MDFEGTVKQTFPVQTFSTAKGERQKASIILEIKEGEYLYSVYIETLSEVEFFAKLTVGQHVRLLCNVISREYHGKYYTNVNAWKCYNQTDYNQPTAQQPQQPTAPQQPAGGFNIPQAPQYQQPNNSGLPF